MKNIWLKIITIGVFLPTIVFAQASSTGLSSAFTVAEQAADSSYSTGRTFDMMLGDIISLILTVIGTVFIMFIVYAGYLWMTATGNEQKVEKAKGILYQSIIGLIIVVGAYAISYFVIRIFNSQIKLQ